MIKVAPQRERDFETLFEKTKIMEEIKCVVREKRDKVKALLKRDVGPTVTSSRPIKWVP